LEKNQKHSVEVKRALIEPEHPQLSIAQQCELLGLARSSYYKEVYIKDYQSVAEAVNNLRAYFSFYNHERLHQALDYQTPAQVYIKHE